jgi:hypothetical protein
MKIAPEKPARAPVPPRRGANNELIAKSSWFGRVPHHRPADGGLGASAQRSKWQDLQQMPGIDRDFFIRAFQTEQHRGSVTQWVTLPAGPGIYFDGQSIFNSQTILFQNNYNFMIFEC